MTDFGPLDPDWLRQAFGKPPQHNPLPHEKLLEAVDTHFRAIRAAIDAGQVAWHGGEVECGISYSGVCSGYTIVVVQANVEGKGVTYDGAITALKTFTIVHLTPGMAKFCFDAANAAQN